MAVRHRDERSLGWWLAVLAQAVLFVVPRSGAAPDGGAGEGRLIAEVPKEIWEAESLEVSSDCRSVVWIAAGGGSNQVFCDGRKVAEFARIRPGSLRLAPDGRLAFVAEVDGQEQVMSQGLASRRYPEVLEETLLLTPAGKVLYAAKTADGLCVVHGTTELRGKPPKMWFVDKTVGSVVTEADIQRRLGGQWHKRGKVYHVGLTEVGDSGVVWQKDGWQFQEILAGPVASKEGGHVAFVAALGQRKGQYMSFSVAEMKPVPTPLTVAPQSALVVNGDIVATGPADWRVSAEAFDFRSARGGPGGGTQPQLVFWAFGTCGAKALPDEVQRWAYYGADGQKIMTVAQSAGAGPVGFGTSTPKAGYILRIYWPQRTPPECAWRLEYAGSGDTDGHPMLRVCRLHEEMVPGTLALSPSTRRLGYAVREKSIPRKGAGPARPGLMQVRFKAVNKDLAYEDDRRPTSQYAEIRGAPVFSDDDRTVMFVCRDSGRDAFVVIRDKEEKVLPALGPIAAGPVISPTGAAFGYVMERASGKSVVVNQREGAVWDDILRNARGEALIFDGPQWGHYLARRGNAVYLVTVPLAP